MNPELIVWYLCYICFGYSSKQLSDHGLRSFVDSLILFLLFLFFNKQGPIELAFLNIKPKICCFLKCVSSSKISNKDPTVNSHEMGRDMRKPVLGVFDIARLEPACSATETS